MTLLIVARLAYARWRVTRACPNFGAGTPSPYLTLSAMLIESLALYSAFLVPLMTTIARGDPSNFLFLTPASMVQVCINSSTAVQSTAYADDTTPKCIAPLLIILRVAQGRAWTRRTGFHSQQTGSANSYS